MDAENARLAPWLDGFERTYGARPRLFEREGRPGEFAITFPPVFDLTLLGGTGHFGFKRHLADHVASLGFGWDDQGKVITSPTPATLNARLSEGAGYRVELVSEGRTSMATGPWLCRYLDGVIPVHVEPREFYLSGALGDPRWHFSTLAHDLTVHALNYHLVPRALALELGQRIRSAVPESASRWPEPGARCPLTLAFFFDNDFNRYCYEAWARSERPSDFAGAFARKGNFQQLLGALEVRLEETRAGKGDVPSERSEDLPPLAKVAFALS